MVIKNIVTLPEANVIAPEVNLPTNIEINVSSNPITNVPTNYIIPTKPLKKPAKN